MANYFYSTAKLTYVFDPSDLLSQRFFGLCDKAQLQLISWEIFQYANLKL